MTMAMEEFALSQSLEDYVEAIYNLIESSGLACVRDVAKVLRVKMPSVVKAIHELKKLGLVTQQPYSSIELTAKGVEAARSVLSRHRLLRTFLVQLGVGERTADADACRMEHVLSAETLDRIRIFSEKGNVRKKRQTR